jgi:hypothetical protein
MPIVSRLIVLFLIASAPYAAYAQQGKSFPPVPEQYRIEPPRFPAEDRSRPLGPRLLRLMSIQAERNLRWIEAERKPRAFFTSEGPLEPDPARRYPGPWVNVDDRMGYIALGQDAIQLVTSTKFYHTWEFAFVPGAAAPGTFKAGERISAFALVSCPNQTTRETAAFADRLRQIGWKVNRGGVLAIAVDKYLVHANFSAEMSSVTDGNRTVRLPPMTAGWGCRSNP